MTKQLQEFFDLPSLAPKEEPVIPIEIHDTSEETLTNLEKIENALPRVKGLESSDEEMDELSRLAISSYKDLQELGMQVDSRFSAEIFNSASSFLGHAITAKTAKLQKKLKMVELQLKKAALDQKEAAREQEIENIPAGAANSSTRQVLDRNEMLKLLLEKSKPSDKY